ncbi:MAG: peptidoglycan editing factor PgeF [Chloroflexota bacterium]|nr:peptidoglycan editing factor PgeF [Chloroflexota bacterium]
MDVPTPSLLHFPSLEAHSGLVHGVSTRQGGVSTGPFSSLNLGWTVGDSPENVEANHGRLARALAVRRQHLTTTWQVHSNRILRAEMADRGTMIDKADGIVTNVPDLPLSQRFADCTPLLVYDPGQHAAGLAHGGWRGTVANVAGSLVAAMVEAFDSRPEELLAVVGPAIGPCCYEVGPEVIAAVTERYPHKSRQLLRSGNGRRSKNGRAWFDLWESNRWQLAEAGVEQIEVSAICTACHRNRFYSHRADGGRTGRFGAVVMLRA